MTATYTCIACGASIPPASAVIVGVDIGGYPDRLPTNVTACRGCEDAGRAIIRKALAKSAAAQNTMPVEGTLQAILGG
jgi:hypothetical protein